MKSTETNSANDQRKLFDRLFIVAAFIVAFNLITSTYQLYRINSAPDSEMKSLVYKLGYYQGLKTNRCSVDDHFFKMDSIAFERKYN